jgi:hypothetical protein
MPNQATFFACLKPAAMALLAALTFCTNAWAKPDNGMQCLLKAYPTLIRAIDGQDLLLVDGSRLPYGKGTGKDTGGNFEARLNSADLNDQMSQCYPGSFPASGPALNDDPGRLRYEAFFLRLYGASSSAVRSNLRPVMWTPAAQSVQFTGVGGADQALSRVAKAIAARPELVPLVARLAGTFNWRPIQGTTRMSSHSFGAAIDFQLPANLGKYWLWAGCKPGGPCRYPDAVLAHPGLQEVVRIFEANGFIWGGKWHHFDTLHFEYRPELLVPECAC